jgi:hypothetical protein
MSEQEKYAPMFGRATLARARPICTATALFAALTGCGGSNDGGESNKINGSINVPAGRQFGLRSHGQWLD